MTHAVTRARPQTVAAARPGRPTDYSREAASAICELLVEGFSLRAICAADGTPDKSTVCRWLASHPEFRDQYRLAREMQADALADECIEIVDGAIATRLDLEHAQLRVKARQWYASKLHPRVYGDTNQASAADRRGAPPVGGSLHSLLPPPPR